MQTEPVLATDQLSIELPPQASYVSMARMFAGSVARHFGCDEDRVEDVKIATSEACTNAIKAHQALGKSASVKVLAGFDGSDTLTFRVVDEGAGFDLPESFETDPGDMREGSLGLSVLHALFQTAEVSSGETGTTVTFSLLVATATDDD